MATLQHCVALLNLDQDSSTSQYNTTTSLAKVDLGHTHKQKNSGFMKWPHVHYVFPTTKHYMLLTVVIDSVYLLLIMGVAKLGLCHVDTAHMYYNQNSQQVHSNSESIL